MMFIGVVVGAFTGNIDAVTEAAIDMAKVAVNLAIGLIGIMALWLGVMKIAEESGLIRIIARGLRPITIRLFPDIPEDHPAIGSIVLNMSANILGLGNAATPLGLKAMEELQELNPNKETATNAMCTFLAINTSSVTLLPTGVIALRAAAGSQDPAGILPTTLFATILSTTVAIISVKLYQRYFPVTASVLTDKEPPKIQNEKMEHPTDELKILHDVSGHGYPGWVSYWALGGIVALVPLTVIYGRTIAPWIIPSLALAFLIFSFISSGNFL